MTVLRFQHAPRKTRGEVDLAGLSWAYVIGIARGDVHAHRLGLDLAEAVIEAMARTEEKTG